MSQSTTRIHWIALTAAVTLLTAACAIKRIGPPAGVPMAPVAGAENTNLYYVGEIVSGVRLGHSGIINALAGREVRLIKPVAISGFGNDIYIADAGKRTLYRYDRLRRGFYELKDAGSMLVGDASQIYAAVNNTFYVVDPFGKQVLQFDRDGNAVRQFKNTPNVPQPVAVSVDHATGQVQIADGTHGYVVIFNKVGQALFATGSRGDDKGQFRMITAMSSGPDGMYVADRLRGDIQVLGREGNYLYSFGKGNVTFPSALVVSADNRVIVADTHDNTLKIFRDGKLIEKIGNTGNGPGQFSAVTDMWLSDDNKLYVADSLNNRIQVFQLRVQK